MEKSYFFLSLVFFLIGLSSLISSIILLRFYKNIPNNEEFIDTENRVYKSINMLAIINSVIVTCCILIIIFLIKKVRVNMIKIIIGILSMFLIARIVIFFTFFKKGHVYEFWKFVNENRDIFSFDLFDSGTEFFFAYNLEIYLSSFINIVSFLSIGFFFRITKFKIN